jgi:nitroreductase
MLEAAANGLGSVAVGAFYENEVSGALKLPKGWAPYLIVPVGVPAK